MKIVRIIRVYKIIFPTFGNISTNSVLLSIKCLCHAIGMYVVVYMYMYMVCMYACVFVGAS